jgi:DNA-directed RNA polymerase specialized sigma24 family protein
VSREAFDRVVQDTYPMLLRQARAALGEPALGATARRRRSTADGDAAPRGVRTRFEAEEAVHEAVADLLATGPQGLGADPTALRASLKTTVRNRTSRLLRRRQDERERSGAVAPVGDESDELATAFGERRNLGQPEGGVEDLADPGDFPPSGVRPYVHAPVSLLASIRRVEEARIAALDLERAFRAAGTPPEIQKALVAVYVQGFTWADCAARYQLHPDVVRRQVEAHRLELQSHLPDYRPVGARVRIVWDRTRLVEDRDCPFCHAPIAGQPPITCKRCRTAIPGKQ